MNYDLEKCPFTDRRYRLPTVAVGDSALRVQEPVCTSETWRCQAALDVWPLARNSTPFFLRIAPGLGLPSYQVPQASWQG